MTDDNVRIVLDTEDWDNEPTGSSGGNVMWHPMPTSFARPFTPHELTPDGPVGDQYFD